MRLGFWVIILVSFSLFIGVFSYVAIAATPSAILIDLIPEYPGPREITTINLSSYTYNLDSISITWFVDGKMIESGIGKKSFSVTAGEAGTKKSVVATLAFPDGALDIRVNIQPNVMALLWQADDSYVPPFYRGKPLPTPDSPVTVVAMPEIKKGGQLINPKNMVYSWKKDYTNDPNASGYGKNSLTYINDYLDEVNNISVVASTTDQSSSSTASLNINTYNPKIVFYEHKLEEGTIWEKALASGFRVEGKTIIEAAPYFISPSDLRIPSLIFSWGINNNSVEAPLIKRNQLPVEVAPETSGYSSVRLDVENKYKIFSTASKEIEVQF